MRLLCIATSMLVIAVAAASAGDGFPPLSPEDGWERLELDDPDLVAFVRYEYYSVEGSSVGELGEEFREKGPEGFAAFTHWYVRWRWWCGSGRARVRLEVAMTLPRWERPGRVSAQLRKAWSDFMKALLEHERGHQRIGLSVAREILDVVRSTAEDPACGSADEATNARAYQLLEGSHETERGYDERTDHGRTQGAYLTCPDC